MENVPLTGTAPGVEPAREFARKSPDTEPHTRRDIIVVGASAGGVSALTTLIASLPADLPAVMYITLHVSPTFPSLLPQILNRCGTLPVEHARDGETPVPGHVYVAPPDYHLLAEKDRMRLSHGPRENRSRPAIDPLFRSAAAAYGPRVVGVVLTGMLSDGSAGLVSIKRHGGIAVTQSPDEAQFPSMPRSVITRDHPDYVLPLAEIAMVLAHLARPH